MPEYTTVPLPTHEVPEHERRAAQAAHRTPEELPPDPPRRRGRGTRRVTEEDERRILTMLQDGVRQADVSQKLGWSIATVAKVAREWRRLDEQAAEPEPEQREQPSIRITPLPAGTETPEPEEEGAEQEADDPAAQIDAARRLVGSAREVLEDLGQRDGMIPAAALRAYTCLDDARDALTDALDELGVLSDD